MLRKDMEEVLVQKLREDACSRWGQIDCNSGVDDSDIIKYAMYMEGIMDMMEAAIRIIREETDETD